MWELVRNKYNLLKLYLLLTSWCNHRNQFNKYNNKLTSLLYLVTWNKIVA